MPRYLILFLTLGILLPVIGCKKFDHVQAERTHLRMVGLACESYALMANEYPDNLQTERFPKFLDGGSLDDQWGVEIKYQRTDDGYSVLSGGPDKEFGTIDDIEITSKQIQTWKN